MGKKSSKSRIEPEAVKPRPLNPPTNARTDIGNDLEFNASGPLRPWEGCWRHFVDRHRSWWDRVREIGPIYMLPIPIIDALTREEPSRDSSHRPSKGLINAEEAKAELDLRKACTDFASDIVGVWEARAIRYDLLGDLGVEVGLSDREMAEMGWTDNQSPEHFRRVAMGQGGPLKRISQQRLGYVGKLTFDAQYRREKGNLKAQWETLPDRPLLPLDANVADKPVTPIVSLDPHRDQVVGDEVEQFLVAFGQFMRKYRLSQMVTWDLPMPQGPLEQVPLGVQVTVLGPDEAATTFPSYYDIPSNLDVRKKIREQQRQAGIAQGNEMQHPVTDASSRSRFASQHESAFRMWLVEQAVRSRYGSPRGLVTRLNRGFADLLDTSEERVKKIRSSYSSLLT